MKKKKASIELLKKLEKTFPGDSLLNDLNNSLTLQNIGVDEDTFRRLKILERSGLIIGFKYKLEGFPESEKVKTIDAIKITPAGIDFLNGLKQKKTNIILIILTILMTLIGGIQIFLLIK